jgi:hypothetical protein
MKRHGIQTIGFDMIPEPARSVWIVFVFAISLFFRFGLWITM